MVEEKVIISYNCKFMIGLCMQYGDSQARQLWMQLLPKIPNLFNGLMIKPALLHGDLWSGNAAETDSESGKNINAITQLMSDSLQTILWIQF